MISAVREKCAGLDVHRDTVVACVMRGPGDVFGASGVAMLEALIVAGESDPQRIAELAKGSLRKKKEQIAAALEGFQLLPPRPDLAHLLSRLGKEE